jgi:hypothetical protein
LAPLSAAVPADKSVEALAIVAGLIAAVRLARVESGDSESEPTGAVHNLDSITIARMAAEASKAK